MERRRKMKKGILAFVVLAFALAVVGPLFAEEAAQEKAASKPALKTEVIQLKYREAGWTQPLLKPFLSGFGQITYSQGGDKILVVSDIPENVEKVLQAVKQIDLKPADILLTVQLVLGSDAEEKGEESLQSDPIIKELRNLLRYKSYSLLDTSLIRAMDGGSRSAVRLGPKGDFRLSFRPRVFKDEKASYLQMEIGLEGFVPDSSVVVTSTGEKKAVDAGMHYETLIGTTLNIKSGDKTVVGVSKLDGGGKGLILIISGKIVD
jgi:hypothetical protein